MPTGYTADIANDISFEDFVLKAAEAFGYGRSAKFNEDSYYYTEEYSKASTLVNKLERLTREEKLAFATSQIEAETTRVQDDFNKAILLKNKYEAMLDKVRNWDAGSEFQNLKQFMISQIVDSIAQDCRTDYYIQDLTRLATVDKMAEYERLLQLARDNCQYYQDSYEAADIKYDNQLKFEENLRAKLG